MRLGFHDSNMEVFFLFLVTVLQAAASLRPVDEHRCIRPCDSAVPMTCRYKWTVNWHYTMSDQCGNCPSNASDCSNNHCVSADGVRRPVAVVNQAFPAPSVQICSGDEVVISVTNNMLNNEAITIHWHGIFQNGSQYMDGVPMVTQCPIPSPGRFEYRFTPYEPGTHWFHSHTGLQISDGMMGPFIIRETKETDPSGGLYDEDSPAHVILMNDWYHVTTVSEFTKFDHFKRCGDDTFIDAILINGKGMAPGTNPPHPPLEVFNVERGKTYRFRVINGASGVCNMQFSIQNHSLLMIASDGASFTPQDVDFFRISPGERFDFVLNASQPVGNYQIQVIGLPCTNRQREPAKQIAYVHYQGAKDPPTIDQLPNIKAFGENSTWWQNFPSKSFAQVNSTADKDYRDTSGAEKNQVYIQVAFGNHTDPTTDQSKLYPQLDSITFQFPTSPVLSQLQDLPKNIFCNNSDHATGKCDGKMLCSCVHTINVRQRERVEVILVNPDYCFMVLHPMHLHGQQFKVVAMGKVNGASKQLVRELLANGSIVRNDNGPWKDVIVVPNGGYTIFQFQGWNPGWWIFHCHIEFHLEEGMALLFHVQGDVPPVPDAFPTCGVWPPLRSKSVSWDGWKWIISLICGLFVVGVVSGLIG